MPNQVPQVTSLLEFLNSSFEFSKLEDKLLLKEPARGQLAVFGYRFNSLEIFGEEFNSIFSLKGDHDLEEVVRNLLEVRETVKGLTGPSVIFKFGEIYHHAVDFPTYKRIKVLSLIKMRAKNMSAFFSSFSAYDGREMFIISSSSSERELSQFEKYLMEKVHTLGTGVWEKDEKEGGIDGNS